MTAPVTVTQADRKMAARAVATESQLHLKTAILRGDYDYSEAVKAFAEHRTATEAATAAREAELVEALEAFVATLTDNGNNNDRCLSFRHIELMDCIAKAVLALAKSRTAQGLGA